MSLSWKDLNFTTGVLKKKRILCNLNGSINRGELIALMGPSGAGKSTLLNCITQGEKYKGFEGRISISGLDEPIRASFINQDEKEHLLLSLTVSQSLRYASRLKNPTDTTEKVHNNIVTHLIEELELNGTANTSAARCSGGQRKRLAIALELTAIEKPQFLFLDEPTSGLDSYVGLKVVELLSRLSSIHNMAIVATIHQPSFKLFSLFTRAYVISGAGDFIYDGSPSDLTNYLVTFNYPWNIQNNCENPADIIIEIASAVTRNKPKSIANRFNGNSSYTIGDDGMNEVLFSVDCDGDCSSDDVDRNAKICLEMVRHLKEVGIDNIVTEPVLRQKCLETQEQGLCKNGASFGLHNLWILFLRSCSTSIWKQKRFVLIRLALHFIVALVLAVLYDREIGLDDGCVIIEPEESSLGFSSRNSTLPPTLEKLRHESTTMKNVKFQFFNLLFLMFAALMPTVLTFPADIKLFLNEFRNGWYSSSSYYISKTITEIPLQLLFPFLYTYFLYWFTQQPEMDEWYGGLIGFMSWRYGTFLLVTVLSCFIAQGLGFLIGIMCVRSFNISIIVSSSVLLFLFLFSGFFVKRVQMAVGLSWITYFSFIRFAFESLLIIIYGQGRCNKPGRPSVLITFGLEEDDIQKNLWFLVVHLLVIRMIAFLVLKYMSNPNSILIFNSSKILNSSINSILSVRARTYQIKKKLGSLIFNIVLSVLILFLVSNFVAVGCSIYYLVTKGWFF